MWQQWINALLGVWTIIAAWIYMTPSTGRTLMILTGIVVAALALWGASKATSGSGNTRAANY